MIALPLTLLVLLLLLQQGSSRNPEPIFRSVGSVVELGYCLSMDYIVVYRVVREGDQLLSNSSDVSPPVTPPLEFQGRIHTSHNQQILGMQIKHLAQPDAGTYRRECWKNRTLVSYQLQQLIVCDSEEISEEIIVNSKEGGTEITCNSNATGQDGVSVRWYHDVYPSYDIEQLLDSSISLDPVDGVLEVKNNGATLVLDVSMLSNNQHFYCIVNREAQCLSFQSLYLPESLDNKDIFATHGDKVVLYCEADGDNQYWDTPLGKVDNVDERNNRMYLSTGEQSQHFSLVIQDASKDHFGDYSCVSPMYEMQYSLVFCPKKESSEMFIFEDQEVTLHCDIEEVDLYIVQWYRRQAAGQEELVFDSGDDSIPIPDDLRGRINLMDNHELNISRVRRADEGMYWCIVLKNTVYMEDDYEEDEEEEEEDDEEGKISFDWGNENKCLFKQATFLSVNKENKVQSVRPTPPPFRRPPPQSRSNGQAGTRARAMLIVISIAAVFFGGRG